MGVEFRNNRFINIFKEKTHAIYGKKVIPFGGVVPVTPTPSPSFAGYYYEIQECIGPNYGWILSPTPLSLGSGLKISGSSECWEVFAQSGPEPTLFTVTDYYDDCLDCQASIPSPTPTNTPTKTPTPTPTDTSCETCGEWEVEHGGGPSDPDFTFSYVDCYSRITYTGSVSPGDITTLSCICDGSVEIIFGEPSASRLGVCVTPTPTPSITATNTPTPTLTPSSTPPPTPTPSLSPGASPYPTNTPTSTPTTTPTNTPTNTPTTTPTTTVTPTPTTTVTPTNTTTSTNTPTPTITPTTGPCQLVLDYPSNPNFSGTYNKLDVAGILDKDGTDTLLCSGSTTLWYRNDNSLGYNINRFIARTIYLGNDYEFRLVSVIDSGTTINCGYDLAGKSVSFNARLQQNGYYGGLLYPLAGSGLTDSSSNTYSLTYQDCPTPTPTPTNTITPTQSVSPSTTPTNTPTTTPTSTPTNTPTNTTTPTPTPTFCQSCGEWEVEHGGGPGDPNFTFSYVDCYSRNTLEDSVSPGEIVTLSCICDGSLIIQSGDPSFSRLGNCSSPTPTPSITATNTPTPSNTPSNTPSITPSSSPIPCEECFFYDIENTGEFTLTYSYIPCGGTTRVFGELSVDTLTQVCACSDSVVIEEGTGVITEGVGCTP